ncbi:MAG: AAA family ATPase [Planctomycetes bacterium]|nr:AAA family ATPase [Planctomycetota bacterium]
MSADPFDQAAERIAREQESAYRLEFGPTKAADGVPLHDEHAEAGIIAGMIAAPEAARVAVESLSASVFYVPRFGRAFAMLAQLWAESGTIDAHAVLSEAPKHNLSGGELLELAARGNQAPSIERHVAVVKELHEAREVRGVAVKLVQALDDGACPDCIRLDLRREIDRLAPTTATNSRSVGEWLDSGELDRRVSRLPTGFYELDEQLHGGFMPGGLYIVAADTSCGKSTFALNAARLAALSGVRTWFNTLEDPAVQVVRKLLAASARVPVWRLERLEFDQRSRDAIADARKVLHDLPLVVGEVADLSALCLAIEAHGRQGTRLAVVDQRSWVRADGDTEFERAAVTARRLKEAAKASGVVVLLCWQINRSGAKATTGPTLHDLRDSGTAEQDADGVLLLPKFENGGAGCPLTAFVNIAKHRHGPRDREVKLSWWPDCQRMDGWTPHDVTGVRP